MRRAGNQWRWDKSSSVHRARIKCEVEFDLELQESGHDTSCGDTAWHVSSCAAETRRSHIRACKANEVLTIFSHIGLNGECGFILKHGVVIWLIFIAHFNKPIQS